MSHLVLLQTQDPVSYSFLYLFLALALYIIQCFHTFFGNCYLLNWKYGTMGVILQAFAKTRLGIKHVQKQCVLLMSAKLCMVDMHCF